MLRRLLNPRSNLAITPDDVQVSYAEGLIDRALSKEGRLTSATAVLDPLVSVGRLLCELEVDAGLSPPPNTPDQDQFIRTYVKLLLDNDRQPRSLQLTGTEVEMPRALLQSFFTRGATMQMDATKVLRFIETRFAQGSFGQARLLLQLFETDQQTRRNNERNLFFEEMVLRFLSARSGPRVPAKTEDTSFGEVLTLNGISLNTLGHDEERVAAWRALLPADVDDVTADAVLRSVPGPRWRDHWRRGNPVESLTGQFAVDAAQRFVHDLTMRIYFITLYPGATGFEYLVANYLEWMAERFDMVSTRILPRLHRESTLGDHSIDESLSALIDELFENTTMSAVSPTDEQVAKAFGSFETGLDDLDMNDIPAGEYDLGGLVAFDLFDFPAGSFETRFRLSRLA